MIIVNLTGGLGNQMFQYALGRQLAIKNQTSFKLHFTNALFATQRSFGLKHLNIKAEIATDKELGSLGISQNRVINRAQYLLEHRVGIKLNKNILTERSPIFDANILNAPDNTYLQGYWQSPSYFHNINSQILKDFLFIKPMNEKNRNIAKFIKNCNSVSIHIRRGDYVTDPAVKKTFPSVGVGYCNAGMKAVEKRVKSPTYFVFSDDIDWARKNIKSQRKIYFIGHNRGKFSYEDMRLISLCKHNVISNSTFSWWGAFLNANRHKTVVSPKIWSETELGKDIALANWIKI